MTASLAPIPGLTHLLRLEQNHRRAASTLPDHRVNEATALVAIALATYFGVRPPERLNKKSFSPSLIACLSAGKDSQMQPRPTAGPTRLLSSHVRDINGELSLVGTILCRQRSFGYYASFTTQRTRLVLTTLEVTTAQGAA